MLKRLISNHLVVRNRIKLQRKTKKKKTAAEAPQDLVKDLARADDDGFAIVRPITFKRPTAHVRIK